MSKNIVARGVNVKRIRYTSRGHGCGFYSELVFVDSKQGAEMGEANNELCNC